MVNRRSSSFNWVSLYASLAVIALFSALVAADRLQVNMVNIVPAGSEVNVTQNITYQVNVSLLGEAVDNLTNLSVLVSYPTGFVTFLNSSVGVNSSNDGLVNITRADGLVGAAIGEINITNGSSFIFNLTFRVNRNARSFNFTVIVNSTNQTAGAGDVGGVGGISNLSNISYNMSSVVFFRNFTLFSTNFSDFLFNILGIANSDPNALGPVLANANGSINFTRAINLSNANLDINTRIGSGFVAINSSAFDGGVNGTNTTAFVQIYNFTGGCPVRTIIIFRGDNITDNPDIYRSAGQDCILTGECRNISCANNILYFTAMHFSAFVANGNANLTINNTALPKGGLRSGTGTPINFTANYTNATLVETINATCEINLTQGYGGVINANMSQGGLAGNPDTYFFNFTPNRTQIGLFAYNVTCDSPIFSRLTINLTYNVTDNVPPQVANLTPNLNATFNQTSVINISAYIVEESSGVGIDKIFVNITYPNNTVKQFPMTNADGGGAVYNFTFNETLLAFGRYNITIQANDTEGNLNYSVNATFFVNDSIAPAVTNMSPNNKNISVGEIINISVNVSDRSTFHIGSGVNTVLVNITLPESVELIQLTAVVSPDEGNIYIANFSNTTQTGRYNYSILATDKYGNLNSTQSAFFVQSSTTANSTTANSTVANSTVYNTTVTNSNVSNSYVNSSDIQNSSASNSSIQYSTVNRSNVENSTAQNSSLYDATMNRSTSDNSTVTNASAYVSTVNKSIIWDSTLSYSNATGANVNDSSAGNSTLLGSNLTGSNVNVSVFNLSVSFNTSTKFSNVTTSKVNDSYVENSSMFGSNATLSTINASKLVNSSYTQSVAKLSNVTSSVVNNSNVENSSVLSSTVKNSFINHSFVDPSTITNSSVSGDSIILDSTVENSTVISGNLTNVTLNNSRVNTTTIKNSNISNTSTIINSRVENSTLHDIFVQNVPLINGEPNLPNVSAPATNFSTINQSQTIEFAVNVTDLSNVSAVLINITPATNYSSVIARITLTWSSGDEYRGTFTPQITAPTGDYLYVVDANDTVNNHNTTVNSSFKVNDTTPPNVTGSASDIVIGNQSNNFNLTATVTDNTNASTTPITSVLFNITAPDGTYTSLIGVRQGTSAIFAAVFNTTSNQRWGNYTYVIDANDTFNNRNASANSSFVVNDVIPPKVLNASPNGLNISWGATVNISFNATDNSGGRNVSRALVNITIPGTVLIVLDAQIAPGQNDIWIINFSNTTLTGRYNYTIDANDTNNNRNATVGAFFVQTQSPDVFDLKSVPVIGNQTNNFNLTTNVTDSTGVNIVLFNVTAPSGGFVSLIGVQQGASAIYSVIYNTTIVNETGNYTYLIDANDTDNMRNATISSSFVINDVTAPNVTGLSSDIVIGNQTNNYNLTAIVIDNTNGSANVVSVVLFNITSPSGTFTSLIGVRQGTSTTWAAVFNTTSIVEYGNYTYRVDANDTVNNRNNTVSSSFLVNDVTAPNVTSPSSDVVIGNQTTNFNITATIIDNTNSSGVAISRALVNITSPGSQTATSLIMVKQGASNTFAAIFNTTITSETGNYTYRIDANDSVNNRNVTITSSFVVNDVTAPNVTGLSSDIVIGNQTNSYNLTATVIDNTNGSTNPVRTVLFNVSAPSGFVITLIGVRQGTSSVFAGVFNTTIQTEFGNYTYRVDANDTVNNRNATVTSSFIVNDITAPNVTSPSSDIVIGNQTNSFNLTANITDNTNGTFISVNTVLFNVTSPSGTFTSLIGVRQGATAMFAAVFNTTHWTEGGNYTYRIDANDSVNNRNTTVSSTFVVNDVIAPNVTGLSSVPVIGNQSNNYNLTATVFDTNASATSISRVLFNITSPDTTYTSLIGVRQGASNTFSAVFNTTSNQRWGNYTYVVDANDTLNNRNASANSSFVVNDVTPPKVLNASPNGVNISWGEMINISFNATDNSGGRNVSRALVNITIPGTVLIVLDAQIAPGQNDIWIINFSNTTLAGRYNYTIDANDTNNNRNATVGAFFVQSSEVTNSSVANSTVANSTVDNATVVYSNVSNSYVNGTNVQNSSLSNSTAVNSNINRSTVENSTIYNSSSYLSKINISHIENSTLTNSSASYSNVNRSITDNLTVSYSNLTASIVNTSIVENSTIIRSNLTRSIINNSFVDPSTITNSSVSADSTVLDSVIENSSITNATTSNATLNRSKIVNSTILVVDPAIMPTLFGISVAVVGSDINTTRAENSTIQSSNITASTITRSNLTQIRSLLSTITSSNITGTELINSTVRSSFLRPSFGNGPADNGVDDSSLLNVTDVGSAVLQFNRTRAENLTGIGNIHFLCDNKEMEVFNVVFPGIAMTTESRVSCSNLRTVTINGPTVFDVNDSSINSTSGISGVALRNASISNVNQLTNVSVIASTINDSIINASIIISGSSIKGSNLTMTVADNSSVVKSNISLSSTLNQSRVDNSTLTASNTTSSIIIDANLTQARATRSFVRLSNITGLETINSSIINSLLPSTFGNGPADAGVDNSTLTGVTSTGSAVVQFNMTLAENVTSAGNVHFLCDRRIMTLYNVVLPGTLVLESRVFCTDLLNVTPSGTGPLNINHSSINFTTGINSIAILNSSITNVPQLTNASVIESFVNNSVVNASSLVEGTSVTGSNITQSQIDNSSVVKSNISSTSVVNNSRVDNSTIAAANVSNSTVAYSNITGGGIATRSVNNTVLNSTLVNSSVINSTIIASVVSRSFVTLAFVDPSTIVNSTVDGWSNITDSRIENSTVIGSNVTNSTVNNSRINGTNIRNSNVTNTSLLINVTLVENVTLAGVTLQNVPLVTDILTFIAFNTSFETTVNVTRNATFRLVLNNSMAYNVTNLTVVALFDSSYLNYSLSSPQSLANSTSVTGTNYTAAVALGNVISSPLVPGKYIEVNFTYIVLRNHTNVPTTFNVTVLRSDGAVRQFNATLSQTLTQPLPSRADIVASGFAQVGTPQENLTTNLSLVPDASNVSGFQLGNQNGTINWSFHTVNVIGRSGQAAPLIAAPNQGVIFMNGSVTFNTSAWHPSFNTTARVTFYGVGCAASNQVPIVNFSERLTSFALIRTGGRDCQSVGACTNITCAGGSTGNLSFTILHFTSFAHSGNANLTLNSPGGTAGTPIQFTATYVDADTGALITGATCNLSTSDRLDVTMNMSQGATTYNATREVSQVGTLTMNVTCARPGYTTLNSLNNFTINPQSSGGTYAGGGGGGGYVRRGNQSSTETELTPTTVTTPAAIEKPKAQTAFDILDIIKSFYKGVKDYTAFQIIDIIKRFYTST